MDLFSAQRRGWIAIALGVAAVAAALWFEFGRSAPRLREIRLTPGFEGTTTALVAHALASEIEARGVTCRVVETGGTERELESLRAGAVDFALLPGVFRIEHADDVSVVTPLYVEALHLLVRPELAASVGARLDGLRGHTVDVGPAGSASAGLAMEVLRFADVGTSGASGVRAVHIDLNDLDALLDRGDRSLLPDAIFHLATVPSLLAQKLVRSAHYELVALPFAEAFRLDAIITPEAQEGEAARVDRRRVGDASIPAFLYQANPAVPAQPLPTIGAQLQLVARTEADAAAVEHVLEAVYHSPFAHLFHPSLEHTVLQQAPRHRMHPAAIAFLARNEPAVTHETVDELSNTLSVLGALVGGGAFLLQGWRQRRRAARDAMIARYLLRVAEAERRIVETELAADLAVEPLMKLQRELLELKSEALGWFTSGAIAEPEALSDLLAPVNAARAHVGDLLLHAREAIEEQPAAERRTAREAWTDAAEHAADESASPPPQPGGAVTT
jgi:uncharacterized protein